MESLSETPKYQMSISLSVLNHLGIGLYSNVPAVLSEIVANAWDADAENVNVEINADEDTICIYDDGHGMTQDDINKKYLTVGYQKRSSEPNNGITPKFKREPMGRKGIGKLSVFSIADVVEVYSVRNGQVNGLRMNSEEIKRLISSQSGEVYYPTPIDPSEVSIDSGTLIKLTKLKKRVSTTEVNLRKRIARRFSVIGNKHNFSVSINGEEITAKERDYYRSIQFVWGIGESGNEHIERCVNRQYHNTLSSVVDENHGYEISGWLGTFRKYDKADKESNAVVIFSHGKLVHENILENLKEGRIFLEYLTGEIDADFLDDDPNNDIVTSNRQQVNEDSERFKALLRHIESLIKNIGRSWTNLRNEQGAEDALSSKPSIRKWYESLKGDRQKSAKRMLGSIENADWTDNETKRQIYKSALVGFHRLELTDQLSLLNELESQKDFELFSKTFGDVIELERVSFHEIAKVRLNIIARFKSIIDEDKKERVIQQHLFKALWLLDSSWDQPANEGRMEEQIATEIAEAVNVLTEEEQRGRLDIRYQRISGKHVIIELKKYSVHVDFYALMKQTKKYHSGVTKAINLRYPNEINVVEVIAVVGRLPKEYDNEGQQQMSAQNTRITTYDQLIENAMRSYQEYLKAGERISDLVSMLSEVDKDFDEIQNSDDDK